MAKSCKGLAMELVMCLSKTDCVKVPILHFCSYFVNPTHVISVYCQLRSICSCDSVSVVT